MQTIQEVYKNNILPLSEKDRLKLVALIVNEISGLPKSGVTRRAGRLREMFGSADSGHPNGSDNERIDADLARAYADNHEDEE
jgi:hypothetical protein